MSINIGYDQNKTREWLLSPSQDEPGCTVAQELGVDDGSTFGCGTGEFIDALEDLVAGARNAGLFGGWGVVLWTTRDGDGTCDGALVTVDVPGAERLRLSSLHIELRYLTDDTEATGVAAAVAVLDAVAAIAGQVVAGAARALWGDHVHLAPPAPAGG
ncbi:MAG: hypothetical protein ACRDZY_02715 [Acidimicrobiales bacterium]